MTTLTACATGASEQENASVVLARVCVCSVASWVYRWRDCFSDEHYFATLMAALGREDETDCHGYLTNVDWSRGGGHPRAYTEREVSAAR